MIESDTAIRMRNHGRFAAMLALFTILLPVGSFNGGILQAQHIAGEVYGGGHNGTVSGSTSVYVSAGEIGQDKLVGTPYGGVFGGGEGESATVSGNTQVTVAGGTFLNSIYGGGKRANLVGNANVEIFGGVIHVNVYGGARMADVNGYTYIYVHDILGKTTASPVLGNVYGGNDIAGEIKNDNGSGARTAPAFYASIAADQKPSVIPTTFLRVGKSAAATQPYIGNIYGGSDGNYRYVPAASGFDVTLPNDHTDPTAGTTKINVAKEPRLDRTYIEFEGGTVGNIFAGGDSVTVTDAADLHLKSSVSTYLETASIPKSYIKALDSANGFLDDFQTGDYIVNGDNVQFTYEVNRCFGGNNRAAMDIRPIWHLESANVNNLYSGGNKGDMTYGNGILIAVEGKDMIAHNVFGGCRLSNVHPSEAKITAETLNGFDFPAGYAARVLITGGKVYNVYGGNDISGQVYQGATVVIRSDIIENVYGSGNGSYAYYSNTKFKGSDYYFQTNGLTGLEALKALNTHRPNTENVLIDIAGTASDSTFVAGNIFCGGNSATLRGLSGDLDDAHAKLKIGSYVVANGVFLGSNGGEMLNDDIIIGMNDDTHNTSIDLTDHDQMAEYMRGVEVSVTPLVEFASDYVDYSACIGSFFCGGNKGSMSAIGTFKIDFLKTVKIFDKLVAGSNDANVAYKNDSKKEDGTTDANVNHSYVLGGLTTETHPKVVLNIAGLKMEPRKISYLAEQGKFSFDWNHYQGDTETEGDMADYVGYLHGGNIYGGCYNSGYVNGDVQINISESVTTDAFYDHIQNEEVSIDGKKYKYKWDDHLFEPFVSLLTCYGGGYGTETEIWGNTTINIIKNAHIMKVRGGGELGWIGKMKRDATTGQIKTSTTDYYRSYYYTDSTKYYDIYKNEVEQAYDATVHLNADLIYTDIDGELKITNNVSEMCAGGFKGTVTGSTHAIVDNGCVYTVFGGASNANIYGSAETLIGQNGFPYVTQTVYGGNDFGGQVMGAKVYETGNTAAGSIQKVKCNTYVEYFSGELGFNTGELYTPDTVSADFGIFGGGYGEYDYRSSRASGNVKYMGRDGRPKATTQPNLLGKVEIEGDEADFAANCFVNISSKTTDEKDKIGRVYGGGQGLKGQNGVANTRQTYVLLNAANANARPTFLMQYAFGAGDCTTTWYSRLDAYSGNANHLFGACRGISYIQDVGSKTDAALVIERNAPMRVGTGTGTEAGTLQSLSYMGEVSVMNLYPTMIAPQMEVFASGAFSGTKETYLNLYGGHVAEVYGSSYEEGVTYLTQVNVPEGSTLKCNAIFGGGKGLHEDRPCDTYLSTINYNSADAIVEEGIYGGNCDYRFTRRTMISVNVPVKNSLGELVNVYGGGKGKNTISEITYVSLDNGAQVRNVYGGGCDGLVYNKPAVINYMLTKDYYKDKYLIGSAIEGGGTRDASNSYCLGDCEIGGFNTWKNQKGIAERKLFPNSGYEMTLGTLVPTSMGYEKEQYDFNTDVQIRKGALVTENAYGGGYGSLAYTAGCAAVHLLGGTVLGNVYGGGYGGTVQDEPMIAGTTLKDENGNTVVGPMQMNVETRVYLTGGTCTNSFGSGLNGNVYGSTSTYVGNDECSQSETSTFYDGDPTVTRSLYGGGQNGAVYAATNYGVTPNADIAGSGTANVYLYDGHIGYNYNAGTTADSAKYTMNVDYKDPTDSILYNNGNVFGGGYGEDAKTVNSNVIMTGGTVRNSLYGGGEIAAIGLGTVSNGSGSASVNIEKAGKTHIEMLGGHVLRDVFGGGRGYSYDLNGDEVVGTKFYADGYVFGKTDVNIYRGEIGSSDAKSIELGYGNVFAGGNVGFVYSNEGSKWTAASDASHTQGYYYKKNGDNWTNELSEDCRVVISPYTKVTAKDGVTINGKKYSQCSYVSTDELNYLHGKSTADSVLWNKMDYLTGVTVHNAVFAGGNVTRGDSKLYAETKTVYGNATATLNDIYHRDLISVGTEHTGGIYGDGNLTMVDGFREICVVNYGTDYYDLKTEITTEEYYALNDRERAYFQLKYKCVTPYGKYALDQTITDDIYLLMPETEQTKWAQAGFCSVYAGRLLNTIQRADFVGVHGSRIVLQGAQDRTIDVVDYMEYAINRIGEASLNRRSSVIADDAGTDQALHGNYFGFYNTVKYLEALTSDVDFQSVRNTTNEGRHNDGGTNYGTTTYYDYKLANKDKTWCNNASSDNKVALNSGVYLEITTQESTDSSKVYGPITGVVELDLMDMGENLGGAFVYAKNIHGTRSGTMNEHAYISSYNKGAKTNKGFTYSTTTDNTSIETSGNFVHPTKPIVDECYPGSADVESPAHYWFLRGSIYLYDQYISAYTGASTAYKADVQIPLTITAGTHGRLKILAIQPNLYAYYDKDGNKLTADGKGVVVDAKTYHLNDVVTYWDWSQMSTEEKQLFVHDTYIAMQDFSYEIGLTTYDVAKGTVMLSSEYDALPATVTVGVNLVSKSDAVHMSNATSHDNGFALTADISNPAEWDDRYIHNTDADDIITKEAYGDLTAEEKKNYFVGPSYRTVAGVYGQTDYAVGDIVNDEIHGAYTKVPVEQLPAGQATVEAAYITTAEITYTYNGSKKTLLPGVGISKTEYDEAVKVEGNSSKLDIAYVCNSTLQKGNEYIITGELISTTKYNTLSSDDKTMFSRAWICTAAGKYGGTIYNGDQNYDALKGWCDLTAADRGKFTFNYDALDLFIKNLDPRASIADYDKPGTTYYDREIEIDYTARADESISYTNPESVTVSYSKNEVLSRDKYEAIPNEMLYYSCISADRGIAYVVNTNFLQNDVPYTTGDVLTTDEYNKVIESNVKYITKLNFSSQQTGNYFYCKKAYVAGANGSVTGKASGVTDVFTSTSYAVGATVPVGTVITAANYNSLPNLQDKFSIAGTSPVEVSTLYVARDANMADVQKDRVITLIYQYQYDESAEDSKMETITERHVINIHLLFRSGAPSIGRLKVPGAVLPGTSVGLKQPSVSKGAYEILGGGWEIYDSQADADNHINGQPYVNNQSVLYYYQTGKYVTYYAKTYMGKTYSNAVPLSVANYHSINDVMADTEHYMYIDHPDVPRNCKIYIDADNFKNDASKSELDLLRDLYDLSVKDNSPLNKRIKGCDSLDFILQADVSPKKYTTWVPLGSDTKCFGDGGYFHGDGHAVTGLDNSLFGNLCGQIFNTGVKGSFTGAGIAQSGNYAANCWVWNENESGHTGNPVFATDGAALNCYYLEESGAAQAYTPSAQIIRKNETAFNNGEVAYDLNSYYLLKRYNDNATVKPSDNAYSYWTIGDDNTLQLHENEGHYLDEDIFITVTEPDPITLLPVTKKLNYVEYRYGDGDFVNADGQVHTTADERYYNGEYFPIYPDDYIFFGQSLNYGYIGGLTHDTYPTAVVRTDANRVLIANSSSNRVFRAPGYYGSMDKQVAHFNVECVLPYKYTKQMGKTSTTVVQTPATHGISIIMSGMNIDTKTETLADGSIRTTVTTTVDDLNEQTRTITTDVTTGLPTDVYPNLTAIDFTGHDDYGYAKGVSNGVFYTPILDYKTLVDFTNPDETRNMLVYANSTADEDGYGVLSQFLYEPNLVFTNNTYKNIPKVTSAVSNAVQGHLVDFKNGEYVTDRNHFLVDEENFHCPIAFRMGDDYRIWYQRTPCTFSNGSTGYESIVLPFTATLVSAHQKGEITHFYNNDKANHEYWLRGFQGLKSGTDTLLFYRPMTTGAGADSRYQTSAETYRVPNDFLYDYYYMYSLGNDANQDKYQQYYKSERTYENYLYLSANVPYLMAFPGKRFYEFDMSGQFVPDNTLAAIDQLEVQSVSFCSDKGATVNPLQSGDLVTTSGGYTFKGIFQKVDSVLLDAENARIITTTGNVFNERHNIYMDNDSSQTLVAMYPFHAYLTVPASPAPMRTRSFVISSDAPYEIENAELDGKLVVSSGYRVIRIENNTDCDVNVQVLNSAGIAIESLTVTAGSAVQLPVDYPGVYIVNNHKVLVR